MWRPPGVARWKDVEPTGSPHPWGRRRRDVNPAPRTWARPGPSRRKAGLPRASKGTQRQRSLTCHSGTGRTCS
jgi:hypothetical protein